MATTASASPIRDPLPRIKPKRSASGAGRRRAQRLRFLVLAELLAQHAAHLADRAAVGECGADRHEQVAVAAGDVAKFLEPLRDRVLVAVLLERLEPID